MTLIVLGIDALDPGLVEADSHDHLTLESHHTIDTITSHTGEPSTHELWPTIITGLSPEEHGLILEDQGVAWENPVLNWGSRIGDYILPNRIQSKIGAWLLTNTSADAFRVPASYYRDNDIETVFDGRNSLAIGIPNYVVDRDANDREHALRRSLGDLFERDPEAKGGHKSSDPYEFYEQCMEMAMIRIARSRRAVRGCRHELVFSYTSGLDLIGHVTYDMPDLQRDAYDEINHFVGELRDDLEDEDELILVSDHGLQEGVHTTEAMVASTSEEIIDDIECVRDVKDAIDFELLNHDHQPDEKEAVLGGGERVEQQLEDLGYI